MTTPSGGSYPRPEYPRPDWVHLSPSSTASSSRGPTSNETGPSPAADSWTSLNGVWKFAFDDEDIGETSGWSVQGPDETASQTAKEIVVPFAFQTEASGICDGGFHDVVWYWRRVSTRVPSRDEEVLLHFGAVDYEATVWINARLLGRHRGGHVPFSFDVTEHVRIFEGSFTIVVRSKDRIQDLAQPRGKQYWKPQSESIFYKPTTGIWQSVWLEKVPGSRIHNAKIVPDIDRGTLSFDVDTQRAELLKSAAVEISVSLGSLEVARTRRTVLSGAASTTCSLSVALPGASPPEEVLKSLTSPDATILPAQLAGDAWHEGIALWSPEHPLLYDVHLSLLDLGSDAIEAEARVIDRVQTYAGMRKVSLSNGDYLLNNRPYYQRLVLDQGYWPRTGLTPPSDEALKKDILLMKELGLNGARKHQKLEDPRWLYWADRLGFLVWSEMANAYEFSDIAVERFSEEWPLAVKRDLNHPSIVAWTPFNESWGLTSLPTSPRQRSFVRAMYHLTKTIDPQQRPVVDNDGWQHVQTDLLTIHDYGDGATLKAMSTSMEGILAPKAGNAVLINEDEQVSSKEAVDVSSLPIILSEFGGVAMSVSSTSGGHQPWGYHTSGSEEDFLSRLSALIDGLNSDATISTATATTAKGARGKKKLIQGWCYTQLADVEQEVNGLVTADRQFKVDPKKLREVFLRAGG